MVESGAPKPERSRTKATTAVVESVARGRRKTPPSRRRPTPATWTRAARSPLRATRPLTTIQTAELAEKTAPISPGERPFSPRRRGTSSCTTPMIDPTSAIRRRALRTVCAERRARRAGRRRCRERSIARAAGARASRTVTRTAATDMATKGASMPKCSYAKPGAGGAGGEGGDEKEAARGDGHDPRPDTIGQEPDRHADDDSGEGRRREDRPRLDRREAERAPGLSPERGERRLLDLLPLTDA